MTDLSLVPTGPVAVDTASWEEAILGALLIDHRPALADCRATGLKAEHFSTDRNRVLFRAFEVMADQGHLADPMSLMIFLESRGTLARVGGPDTLQGLIAAVPTAANVRYYAAMLVRAATVPTEMVAQGEQEQQVGEALRFLALGADDFLRWPLAPLDKALGGIMPGTMHVFVAHTGTGKTSLCETLKKLWLMAGRKVYGAGLEMAPYQLRTQLACRFLGLDHGELFRGNLQRDPRWPEIREKLLAEVHRQRTEADYQRVRLAPFERLTAKIAASICERADAFGADVVLIDHLDHLDAIERGSNYQESLAVMQVIEALTKSYGLRMILTSQTNKEGKSGNRLRDHYPITSEMVRYGDHKINAATTFSGLRRPIKPDVTKPEMAAARADYDKVREILLPHTMAVNVLKDRYGTALGEDIRLGFWRGEVLDDPGLTHGIATQRRTLA